MSMASPGTEPDIETFRVGDVFSRTIGLLSRQFLLFFLATSVAHLPGLISGLWLAPIRPPQPRAVFNTVGLVGVTSLILASFTQTIVFHAALQEMLGRPIRFGASFSVALRRFVPVVGTAICMGVAIGFGFILLVIPGILWATMFAVALPACAVEQLGPIPSLGRSRFLSYGNRWKILGTGSLFLAASVAVRIAANVTTVVSGPVFGSLFGFLVQSVLDTVGSVFAVVMYHDLRVSREGVTTDRIAAAFD